MIIFLCEKLPVTLNCSSEEKCVHDTWNEWQTIVVRWVYIAYTCRFMTLMMSVIAGNTPQQWNVEVEGKRSLDCLWLLETEKFSVDNDIIERIPIMGAHVNDDEDDDGMNDKVCQCSSAFIRLIGAVLQLELLEFEICGNYNWTYVLYLIIKYQLH